MVLLTLPTLTARLAEGEFNGGGHVSPTITCAGAETIYVYEVIHYSGDEGQKPR